MVSLSAFNSAPREARGTFQPKHLRKGRWLWVTCTTAEAISALVLAG
jgi:hypothetical protein